MSCGTNLKRMKYCYQEEAKLDVHWAYESCVSMSDIEAQIARDICRYNKICTCVEKDGHCASIIAIAKRLAKQGYIPPSMQKGECK